LNMDYAIAEAGTPLPNMIHSQCDVILVKKSKFTLSKKFSKRLRIGKSMGRCICGATVNFVGEPLSFNIFCTHLDNRYESIRTKQLEMAFTSGFGGSEGSAIMPDNSILPEEHVTKTDFLPHILMGDFNALSKSDYDDQYWSKLVKQRAENNWDPPKTDLYQLLTVKLNYRDCFPSVKLSPTTTTTTTTTAESISTVWSGERIDWVLLSKDFPSPHYHVKVEDYQVINNNASDHFPVKVTLCLHRKN